MFDGDQIPSRVQEYEPFFGSWYIDALIGKGHFGTVFRIKRESFGHEQYAALKWIPVPPGENEIRLLRQTKPTDDAVREHFYNICLDLEQEILLMDMLKKASNIVTYEDHLLKPNKDGISYDIFIRMELLTPLLERLQSPVTVYDAIKLGIDLCEGLKVCQEERVIHRDIKPANIFIDSHGNYKLGDFGVARQLDESMGSMSVKGTPSYMAPEVYKGLQYDATVDTYSLGLVLYRMFNRQRVPLLPADASNQNNKARDKAFSDRISGVPLPHPLEGFDGINRVLAKATAYEPKKRFQSPKKMQEALQGLLRNERQMRRVLNQRLDDDAPEKSPMVVVPSSGGAENPSPPLKPVSRPPKSVHKPSKAAPKPSKSAIKPGRSASDPPSPAAKPVKSASKPLKPAAKPPKSASKPSKPVVRPTSKPAKKTSRSTVVKRQRGGKAPPKTGMLILMLLAAALLLIVFISALLYS